MLGGIGYADDRRSGLRRGFDRLDHRRQRRHRGRRAVSHPAAESRSDRPESRRPAACRNSRSRNSRTFNLTAAIDTLNAQGKLGDGCPANAFVQKTNQAPSGLSLSLPILKNPSSRWDCCWAKTSTCSSSICRRSMSISASTRCFKSLDRSSARLPVRSKLHADLAFGYDTLGLRQFNDSGYNEPLKLANGFFIYDRVDGREIRRRRNRRQARTDADGHFDRGSGHWYASVSQRRSTATSRRKSRSTCPTGIRRRWPMGRRDSMSWRCGINVQERFRPAWREVNVGISPFDFTVFKKNIARATLLDYQLGCVVPTPLATLANGVLTLNVGSTASTKKSPSPGQG